MLQSSLPRITEPLWTPHPGGCPRLTGAFPTPMHTVLRAPRHSVGEALVPAQFAIVPGKLDPWGNNQYGDCVSAEEAFAKACYSPEIFIPASTVIAWAQAHGYLNGANLTPVMDSMAQKGMAIGSQLYNDGPYSSVDYSNEAVLQSAIATGPVKLGMASGALPSGAGNQQGWYAVAVKKNNNEDHCTGLSGFGSAQYLYQQLGVPYPSGVNFPAMCYLFYTWATLGVVSHDWLMGCVGESWVRNPTTVGVPPLPAPTPPIPPVPPTPTPGPTPAFKLTWKTAQQQNQREIFRMPVAIQAGTYGVYLMPPSAEAVPESVVFDLLGLEDRL